MKLKITEIKKVNDVYAPEGKPWKIYSVNAMVTGTEYSGPARVLTFSEKIFPEFKIGAEFDGERRDKTSPDGQTYVEFAIKAQGQQSGKGWTPRPQVTYTAAEFDAVIAKSFAFIGQKLPEGLDKTSVWQSYVKYAFEKNVKV